VTPTRGGVDSDSDSVRRWAAVVGRVEPDARLVGIRTCPGGLSATRTILELERPVGPGPNLVVRQVRDPRAERRSLSISDEFHLLVRLRALGLPTPTPRLLDDSGTIFDHPYAVLDYVDGAPRVDSPDPAGTGRLFATHLAAVHQVDGSLLPSSGLPSRTDAVGRQLEEPPLVLDGDIHEGFVRQLLRTLWAPPDPDRLTLLHGDFWAGNLLWKDDEIVAVIDWEEAALGDPLTDVATTRLDLLWAFGPAAMSAFTDHYFSLTSAPAAHLPLWDLVASLRPAGVFSAWVADWVDFGRPDMNAPTMRAQHRWFLDRALGALGVPGPPAVSD
jgi:aminoglycoside phosphotransferase (APT) family kinase protein